MLNKKIVLSSLVLASSLFALSEVSKDEIKSMEDLNIFKKFGVKIDKAYDIGSLYQLNISVKNQKDRVYLTKDKTTFIAGDALDTKTAEPIVIPADMSITKGKEAFTFGNGNDEYVLFTDPECPYCKKLESYLPQLKDKIKLRVFYFPLGFHEKAYNLSLYIMSQKTDEEKIKAMISASANDEAFIKFSKDIEENKIDVKKLEDSLNEQIEVAHHLNVQGTPAVFTKDGKSLIWVNLLKKYGIEVK